MVTLPEVTVNLSHTFRRIRTRFGAAIAIGLVLGALAAPPTVAQGVVTKCANDTQLRSRVAGGGLVTFDCGTRTIVLSGYIAIGKDAVIDGGGRITLSGGNAHQLFAVAPGKKLTLRRIVLTRGYSSTDGGAIYNDGGVLVLDHTTISHSTADAGSGGAFLSTGPVTLDHSSLHHNSGTNGGAIMAKWGAAKITIRDSTVHDNHTTSIDEGWGGAVYLHDGGDVTIIRSDLYGNASRMGGAIHDQWSTSTITIRDSTLRDNRAIDPSDGAGNTPDHGDGGAIYLGFGGTATLTRVTLSGNRSVGVYGGGAISNYYDGKLTLTDVTISGNHAQSDGGGLDTAGDATLTNVTFVGNRSDLTGNGIDSFGGSAGNLQLRNVLLSNPGDDCAFETPPATSAFDLSSDASCGFGPGRDNVNLKVGPLDTNGGPTRTHRLLPGSPAIDDGTGSGCPPVDQRSVSRPQGDACDVGAFEFRPCAGRPPSPVLLAPAVGARVTVAKVPLDWVGADCAKTFSVTVRQGSSTGPVAFTASGLTASRVTTTSLTRNRSYVWRTTACTNAGCRSTPWRKLIVVS